MKRKPPREWKDLSPRIKQKALLNLAFDLDCIRGNTIEDEDYPGENKERVLAFRLALKELRKVRK
jgi:hypothetical protein